MDPFKAVFSYFYLNLSLDCVSLAPREVFDLDTSTFDLVYVEIYIYNVQNCIAMPRSIVIARLDFLAAMNAQSVVASLLAISASSHMRY